LCNNRHDDICHLAAVKDGIAIGCRWRADEEAALGRTEVVVEGVYDGVEGAGVCIGGQSVKARVLATTALICVICCPYGKRASSKPGAEMLSATTLLAMRTLVLEAMVDACWLEHAARGSSLLLCVGRRCRCCQAQHNLTDSQHHSSSWLYHSQLRCVRLLHLPTS